MHLLFMEARLDRADAHGLGYHCPIGHRSAGCTCIVSTDTAVCRSNQEMLVSGGGGWLEESKRGVVY